MSIYGTYGWCWTVDLYAKHAEAMERLYAAQQYDGDPATQQAHAPFDVPCNPSWDAFKRLMAMVDDIRAAILAEDGCRWAFHRCTSECLAAPAPGHADGGYWADT